MECTNGNLKDMESSTSGGSDKGSCTEALQTGATGWDPVEQGAGKTTMIGGECLSPSNLSSENLFVGDVWTVWYSGWNCL